VFAGGEGKEGEEQEKVTGYLGVGLSRRKAAGGMLSAVVAATAAAHGGAPARELFSGGAGDLQEVDMKLFRGLARAEKGRRWGRGVQSRRWPWQAAALHRHRQVGPVGGEAGSAVARQCCVAPWRGAGACGGGLRRAAAGGIEERHPEMAGIDHRGESARLKSKRGGRREGNGKTRHRGEDKTELA